MRQLPFSEFARLAKASSMLNARNRQMAAAVAMCPVVSETDRRKFHSDLARAASQFIETKVKDYKEVLSNLARALNGR